MDDRLNTLRDLADAETNALNRRGAGTSGEAMVPLPGGLLAPLSAFSGIESMPTSDDSLYLAEPAKYIIKDPVPGVKYVWAAYDEKYGGDKTAGAIRAGRYQPVKKSEIKDKVDFDLHFKTHRGTTEYVHWRDLILVAMPEEYARAQYDAPVAQYIRTLGALQDSYKEDADRALGGKGRATVTQTLMPS